MVKRLSFREQMLQDARNAANQRAQAGQFAGSPATQLREQQSSLPAASSTPPAAQTPINSSREIVLVQPVARPKKSSLKEHRDGKEASKKRRASIEEKGKGVEQTTSKKKRRKIPVLPGATPDEPAPSEAGQPGSEPPEDADDIEASARWFSRITCSGDDFPSLKKLKRRKNYEDASQAGVQLIAQVNRMVIGYEGELKEMDELNGRLEYELEQAVATNAGIVNSYKDQVDLLEKERDMAVRRALQSEEDVAAKDAELASLQRELETIREAQKNLIREERRAAQREMADDFSKKASVIKAKVDCLRGDATTKMLHLGQIENNLVFVEELLSENPPNVEEEKLKLQQAQASLEGADEDFDKILDEIEGELWQSFLPETSGTSLTVLPLASATLVEPVQEQISGETQEVSAEETETRVDGEQEAAVKGTSEATATSGDASPQATEEIA